MATFSGCLTDGLGDGRQLAMLHRKALDRADGDRLVQYAATARGLAGRRADPAAHGREGVDLGGDGVGVVVAARSHEADIAAGVSAGGAGLLAGRDRRRLGIVDHRRPDLPRLGSGAGRPAEQVTPRRVVLRLEGLARHRRQRDPGIVGDGRTGAVDRALARRQGDLAVSGDQGHDAGRAFANADPAPDALPDLEWSLHRPGQGKPGPRARLDPGASGRLMSSASTGHTSMQTPHVMQPL